jgi:hypothetical protein
VAKATGHLPQYCTLIRRGLRISYRRHWRDFAELLGQEEMLVEPLH